MYFFPQLWWTRMHSSRMRTGRSLTVYWHLLPGGGLPGPGGVSAWTRGGLPGLVGVGVCLVPGGSAWSQGGAWSQRGSAWSGGGGLASQHALRQTPHPPLLTESQTPAKTLPWPNFVAAGKNDVDLYWFSNCDI